jgi:hypothetical protein
MSLSLYLCEKTQIAVGPQLGRVRRVVTLTLPADTEAALLGHAGKEPVSVMQQCWDLC